LRELDGEMAEASNALYRDKITGAQACIAKRIVCRNASAQERSLLRIS
jgi:hypothetical protein